MAILKGLWASEPVRTALYPVIAALVIAGIAKAGLDGSVATLLVTLVAGVLGVPVVSAIRNQVTPLATVTSVVDAVTSQVDAAVLAAPPEIQAILNQGRAAIDDIIGHFHLP